jgi:glycosyltransferase involved in cell wall biosynthesis
MIRLGVPPIGGRNWTGGFNYLVNLATAVAHHGSGEIELALFLGNDVADKDVARLEGLSCVTVHRDPRFDEAGKSARLARAMATGIDHMALSAFRETAVDVAFEPATFFGWRFPLPAIAWIPDFQHLHLPGLFSRAARWRRDLGFRAQIHSKRTIMLSSEDARADCERNYPQSRGQTHVVRFATPSPADIDLQAARDAVTRLGLPESFFFLPNQFWRHKNHLLVIDALKMLRQRGEDVVVVATGREHDPRSPGYFPGLVERIELLGLTDHFRILGMVPLSDVRALMLCCAGLINPSRFEGWSTTVEEAKAAGAPLLLSSIAVHREQAGDEGVYYFSPDRPEELAQGLAGMAHQPNSRDEASISVARQKTHARIRAFVWDFENVVRSAATQ